MKTRANLTIIKYNVNIQILLSCDVIYSAFSECKCGYPDRLYWTDNTLIINSL